MLSLGSAFAQPVSMPGSPLGICWGMIYGQPFTKAEIFLPQVRRLGAGFTRVILFWSQLEPEKGKYNWGPLDAWLDQLHSPEEAVLTLYSSSPWAARSPAWVFPPSPARDPGDYGRFIRAVVSRAKGRIRYFQNDSEPNNPTFWAGTKEEFAAQLRVFAKAVRDADPGAKVVLGGCDGLFDPTGAHPLPNQDRMLGFFEYVMTSGAADFDVFDLHLYADPYTIPARVNFIRSRMAAHGYQKPIIAAEYNGPGFFEFPVNRKHFALLSELATVDESAGVQQLYAQSESLPPETRMFLQNAPAALRQRLRDLQRRDLIIRNVLALSAGIQKIAFWDLWHETEKRDQVKTLLYGDLKLVDRNENDGWKETALGSAFRDMASQLAGVTAVERVPVQDETVFAFRIARGERGPVYVVWSKEEGSGKTATLPDFRQAVPVTAAPQFILPEHARRPA